MNDPPQDNVVAIGDVLKPTNISNDPPSKFVSVVNVPYPTADDEVLEEIQFEDDNTIFGFLPLRTSLNIFQKPSSSKANFYFRISSSSEASDENVEPKQNNVVPPPLENTSEGHQNSGIQEVLDDDGKSKEYVDHKSKTSTSDTGSSDENIVDPFALLELRDNVAIAYSEVGKVTQQVAGLKSKLDLVLKSMSEIKDVTPSELDHANQLNHLISLHLIHTLKEPKACYKDNMDPHITTVNTMLKVYDDIFSATNTLIKQTYIRHEK
ncbi:unnamed protein product [Lactuca saligna]|uniref:Uncharacterized protein n=1 Tax=Lactuca saligna TaxID=75948 RepID=A0AA36EI55_LACSI|nr:unnamed protein product [Lactuca saligna]